MFPVLLWYPDNQARTVGMLEEDWSHLRTLLVGICQKKAVSAGHLNKSQCGVHQLDDAGSLYLQASHIMR